MVANQNYAQRLQGGVKRGILTKIRTRSDQQIRSCISFPAPRVSQKRAEFPVTNTAITSRFCPPSDLCGARRNSRYQNLLSHKAFLMRQRAGQLFGVSQNPNSPACQFLQKNVEVQRHLRFSLNSNAGKVIVEQ
jgi:hypothetical protein